MISMIQILKTAIREGASDIHITTGAPPSLRVRGEIIHLNVDPLTSQQSRELCYSVITDEQKQKVENEKDVDFSFSFDDESRFRGHIYFQKKTIAGCFRQIPTVIPTIEEIGMPPILSELSTKPYGLVLVTGPTGSGKTTTLAAMINEINNKRRGHILTIEDPIEFIYSHKKCIINQREIGFDTVDFHQSLRAALRLDPDICLLGEMRDKETVETALHVAETGHLTFGTLHTNNTCQAIDRLTGVFSGDERQMIQTQISQVLQGIVAQRLLPTVDGSSRVPAVEVLLFPPAIRNLVKEGKQNQMYSIMQTQKALGMITLNQSLVSLVMRGIITEDVALSTSYDTGEFVNMLSQAKRSAVRGVARS
ncbi:MAG: type IV pilus twitching motility protein PilT [Bdellovibrionales bacterium]|nr:type IV pilus twitching motility protein PilT [Bdellovibrionales bacterium]